MCCCFVEKMLCLFDFILFLFYDVSPKFIFLFLFLIKQVVEVMLAQLENIICIYTKLNFAIS